MSLLAEKSRLRKIQIAALKKVSRKYGYYGDYPPFLQWDEVKVDFKQESYKCGSEKTSTVIRCYSTLDNSICEYKTGWIVTGHDNICMIENCGKKFTMWNRKHHCRDCGIYFCCGREKNFLKEKICLKCYKIGVEKKILEELNPKSPAVSSFNIIVDDEGQYDLSDSSQQTSSIGGDASDTNSIKSPSSSLNSSGNELINSGTLSTLIRVSRTENVNNERNKNSILSDGASSTISYVKNKILKKVKIHNTSNNRIAVIISPNEYQWQSTIRDIQVGMKSSLASVEMSAKRNTPEYEVSHINVDPSQSIQIKIVTSPVYITCFSIHSDDGESIIAYQYRRLMVNQLVCAGSKIIIDRDHVNCYDNVPWISQSQFDQILHKNIPNLI